MFFNITNHPCHSEKTTWSAEQIAAANEMAGEIVDFGFPACTPSMTDEEIQNAARGVAMDVIGSLRGKGDDAVHSAAMVAGHYIMTVYLVRELQTRGIPCFVGDSSRIAEEVVQDDGSIAVVHRFKFEGFRRYPWRANTVSL